MKINCFHKFCMGFFDDILRKDCLIKMTFIVYELYWFLLMRKYEVHRASKLSINENILQQTFQVST